MPSSGHTGETSKARLYFMLCVSLCGLTLSGFSPLHILSDSHFLSNVCPHHMCFKRFRARAIYKVRSDVTAFVFNVLMPRTRYKFLMRLVIVGCYEVSTNFPAGRSMF